MSPGPRTTTVPSGIFINPAVWPQQTWAKNWGAEPPFLGGAGSPCSIMWPGLRPTSMPSFILIHPTVWPQYTNVRDRTGQTSRRQHALPSPCDSLAAMECFHCRFCTNPLTRAKDVLLNINLMQAAVIMHRPKTQQFFIFFVHGDLDLCP